MSRTTMTKGELIREEDQVVQSSWSREEFELDEDEMNRGFWEACRDLDLHDVWAQIHSARGRMLEELDLLPEDRLDEHAVDWFRDSGAAHYREHLPGLEKWLGDLRGR